LSYDPAKYSSKKEYKKSLPMANLSCDTEAVTESKFTNNSIEDFLKVKPKNENQMLKSEK